MTRVQPRAKGRGSRREFVAASVGTVLAWLLGARTVRAQERPRVRRGPHPTPRPGITAAKVLTATQLAATPDLVPLFDMVREIPEVVDGIRCQCGCSDPPDFYSLLSCYEGEAMARHCDICQGQARLAHRLHRAGNTLDEIREAIDARFG